MNPNVFLPPPGLSSDFKLLINDMKKYTTSNINFHQGDLLAHSSWTAFYVSELFDIKSTTTSPLQFIYDENLIIDYESEGLYTIDVRKVLILSAFLHDIGKAGDNITNYYDKPGHERIGALYLFENNYKTVSGINLNLDNILKDFNISNFEKDIIVCLIAGHWLIGDAMTNGGGSEEYFVNQLINIIYNFISDNVLKTNIPFISLMCMMQLIICVSDVLASQKYNGVLTHINDFPEISLAPSTHKGMDAYNKFNYNDVINTFIPKVLKLIKDGYFLKTTNNTSEKTEDIVNYIINNAMSISDEEFDAKIYIIEEENKDYNLDQMLDMVIEFIKFGDYKKVYEIIYTFNKFTSELFDIIESNGSIKDFISYILTLSSKNRITTIVKDMIYTHKIEFIKELINNNYRFTPSHLGVAKSSYMKESITILQILAEDIFYLIKSVYDSKGYYVNDNHKLYCETLDDSINSVVPDFQKTTLKVSIPIDTLLQQEFKPEYLDILPSFKMKTVDIIYEKDNFRGGYEYLVDVEKGYSLYSEWIKDSINYTENLSIKNLFTLYGYTHNGDELANKFLIGNNASYISFLDEHIYDDFTLDRYTERFLPLYFQLLELVETRNDEDLIIIGEDSSFLNNIKKSIYHKDKYINLISNLSSLNLSIIKEATKNYIQDLDNIIKNAPPFKQEVILYRGVKDKYYYKDPNNKIFINNTFMSTSYTIYNAFNFSEKECCLKKIICKPGTRAIFLECLTSHPNENEILLGLNNNFKILNDEIRTNIDVSQDLEKICEQDHTLMNVTTMVLTP